MTSGGRERWPRSASGVSYPPTPWHLGGELRLSVFRPPVTEVPAGLRDVVPRDHTVVQVAGRATVGVAFAHYTDGGVLAYDELLVALLVRAGSRIRYSIPQIWVSSEESMHGGRELWGIPKQLASFGRGTSGGAGRATMTLDSELVTTLDSTERVRLPGTRKVWLPTAQLLDGRTTVSRNLVVGRVGLLSAHWSFAADGPLDHLAGRTPAASFMITDASVNFGMEATHR